MDRDVSLDEAAHLAGRIRDWLINEEIISGTESACLLGADHGYPPGRYFSKAVKAVDGYDFRQLRTNGMAVIVGRTLFDPGQTPIELVCRHCGSCHPVDADWQDAVSVWYEQQGEGLLRCPLCEHSEPVTEWEHHPAVGFGNLGFEFWNWPPLKGSFIRELSVRVGHRTVYVFGKL